MISTEVKDHVIVFHDKSKKFITQQQANIIIAQSTTAAKGIKVDGSFISFGSISKILFLEEFYNQYPDERPASTIYQREELPSSQLNRILTLIEIKSKRIRALEQMIKGLKKYIDSDKNKGTGKPESLYSQMKQKLQQAYDSNHQ